MAVSLAVEWDVPELCTLSEHVTVKSDELLNNTSLSRRTIAMSSRRSTDVRSPCPNTDEALNHQVIGWGE